MLLTTLARAPYVREDVNVDGMITDPNTGLRRPGAILSLWLQLRKWTGNLEAKTKPGVKFKVRSMEDMVDLIRDNADELGILIYPALVVQHEHGTMIVSNGHTIPVESGTLADVQLAVVAQAVEDGSLLLFFGFGLGVDNQDKAGGKAGTYAFKQALIQALLAGGKKSAKALGIHDTDDEGEPMQGGVRSVKPTATTLGKMTGLLEAVTSAEDYQNLRPLLLALNPDDQTKLMPAITAAKTRAGLAPKPVEAAK